MPGTLRWLLLRNVLVLTIGAVGLFVLCTSARAYFKSPDFQAAPSRILLHVEQTAAPGRGPSHNLAAVPVVAPAENVVVLLNGFGGVPTRTPASIPITATSPVPGDVVISQIYNGGGKVGSTYQNNYVELLNRTSTVINIAGWPFYFASNTGTFGTSISFVSSRGIFIGPGQYLLIQFATGSSNGGPLPITPDLTANFDISSFGKVAFTKSGATLPISTCPLPNSNVMDFVGFAGGANCFEGSGPTSSLSTTTAAIRKSGGCTDLDDNANDFDVAAPSPRNSTSQQRFCFGPTSTTVEFNSASYGGSEFDGSAKVTAWRLGDPSFEATVDYQTEDGTASQRKDYTLSAGKLTFAPGESVKSFVIPIIDNEYVDGLRTLKVKLTNPIGAVLGTMDTADVTISDDDFGTSGFNPLDDQGFFVRQHYYDFLSRLPDQEGLNYWVGQIAQCQGVPLCTNNRRIDVSNAFFFEQEYQQTGAYVFRLYRTAFGNNQPFPNPVPDPANPGEEKKLVSYQAFAIDRARVMGGTSLANSQLDLANAFVERPEFLAKYDASLNGPAFVDALLATLLNDIGVDLGTQRQALIDLYNAGGRGAVLYRLADDNAQSNPINNRALIDAEYNRAFVATQYFGYLRRDPDMAGFLFWLGQVNNAPLRDVPKQHAMVCSFITSIEYQQRFSSVTPHTNEECPR